MAKHSRKNLKSPNRKSYRKRTSKYGGAYKKMVGGTFTQAERQQLLTFGFTTDDIDRLSLEDITFNILEHALSIINPDTGRNFTPEQLMLSFNEADDEINTLDISGISQASDDEHYLDNSMNTTSEDISYLNGNNQSQGSLHLSDLNDSRASQVSLHLSDLNDSRASQGSLHLSDLNDNRASQGSLHLSDLNDSRASQGSLHLLSDLNGSQDSSSANTTKNYSFGGKKRKSYRKPRKVKNVRKTRKHNRKHNRKQRGGLCFGNGVGANNYDPNLSVYNTRELTLFPYKPTN